MREVKQTAVFAKWFKKLNDTVAKIAIVKRLFRLEAGNTGDCKSVGDSVFELRINVSKGYRIYFMNLDLKVILLLIGSDKTSQEADIKKAKKLAKEVKVDGKNF